MYSDLSNGSVIANFSPMGGNEANFCKGYNYDNGRFIFNFRDAVSKISDYVFSDGHQGVIVKLSELALKSDLTDIIMVKSFQGTSITIAENASEKVSIPISTPTGYKVVGKISERWNGGPEMYLSQIDLTPTTFTGYAANLRNSEATSIPTISVLFVKS